MSATGVIVAAFSGHSASLSPGLAKISRYAYEKTAVFKGETANHLHKQVSRFHLADKKAHKRADDLLDDYTYGLIIAFGSGDAI